VTVLLLDLVLIVAVARIFGKLASAIGQPPVVGEIAAGILAGPSFLGADLSETVFPHSTQPFLSAIASIGMIMFMFIAGLEINHKSIGGDRRAAIAVALCSYFFPFLLGCGLAVTVLARHAVKGTLDLALFLGAATSVTAFPVLVRILDDRQLTRSRIGQLGLAGAAIDDLLAWLALAVAVVVAGSAAATQLRLLLVVPFFAVLVWLVRPALARLTRAFGDVQVVVFGVSGALLCAAATEWMGLHLIFGAFIFGTIFPRRHNRVIEDAARLITSIFLPVFFVLAGLRIDAGTFDRVELDELGAIITVAILGKVGGAYSGARLAGIPPRDSATLASLMNTRGLTELIVLTIGLDLGVIDSSLYSQLIAMALITTAMTTPLLSLFRVSAASAKKSQSVRRRCFVRQALRKLPLESGVVSSKKDRSRGVAG
jgi:Kef-type K+ transport system membrane component KefB